MSLHNRTAVVTGATRGIGRGIAIALAEQGAHVIITGRTETGPNSLEATSKAVTAAGGTCQTYVLDHSCDEAVTAWFQTLRQVLVAAHRNLDVFINNAYAAVPLFKANKDLPFWKKTFNGSDDPAAVWDVINGVGLRGNYICAVHATRIMTEGAGGAVINISSWGGLVHVFDPAYCVGKTGVDRMTAEFALEASPNMSYLTLCPGIVATESFLQIAMDHAEELRQQGINPRTSPYTLWNMETPLFVGRVLAAAVADAAFLKQAKGKVVVCAEAADHFNVNDENAFRPISVRSWKFGLLRLFPSLIDSPIRHLIPRTLIPWGLFKTIISTVKYWN